MGRPGAFGQVKVVLAREQVEARVWSPGERMGL